MEQIRNLVIRATDPGLNRDERLDAFGMLVECYQDMACGYAYSILGDFHRAEDAAQEAFIIAFEQLGTLQEPAAFGSWLRRLVHTACSRATRKAQLPTTSLEAAAGIQSPGAMPGQLVEKREMRDEVLKAIGSLPQAEREVTTLFYINGYSQQEVAEFLEVPVSTVKNRLHASRKHCTKTPRMSGSAERSSTSCWPSPDRWNSRIIPYARCGTPSVWHCRTTKRS